MRAAQQTAKPQAPGTGSRGHGKRLGVELYLWLLVAAELVATALLRRKFRGTHGG